MNANATGELLTVPEVARRLRLHRVSIYRAVQRGDLEAVRLGAHGPLRVTHDALERFMRPALSDERTT